MAPANLGPLIRLGPPAKAEQQTWDQKDRHAIVQIFVAFEPQKIISIQFQYSNDDGSLSLSDVFGNAESAGSAFYAWRLDYPSEYITFAGGIQDDCGVLEELVLKTNKKALNFGGFGEVRKLVGNKLFSYDIGYTDEKNDLKLNQFGGFHGTCDSERITSIGVYFRPVMTASTLLRDD